MRSLSKRTFTSQQGSSLLPVLAAIAAISLVAYVVVGYSNDVSLVSKSNRSIHSKLALASSVRAATRSSTLCTDALQGTISFTPPTGGNDGGAHLTFTIPGLSGTNVAESNSSLPDYGIQLGNAGMYATVPSGSTSIISGVNAIWTANLSIHPRAIGPADSKSLAAIEFTSVRLIVDPSNNVIGCEFSFENGCPSGAYKEGSVTPAQCDTPINFFSSRCPAGKFPRTIEGAEFECRSIEEIMGFICPQKHIPVSTGNGGIECKEFPLSPTPTPFPLPVGSYSLSCNSCATDETVVSCNCQRIDGTWMTTSIGTAACPGGLSNIDGTLTCE